MLNKQDHNEKPEDGIVLMSCTKNNPTPLPFSTIFRLHKLGETLSAINERLVKEGMETGKNGVVLQTKSLTHKNDE